MPYSTLPTSLLLGLVAGSDTTRKSLSPPAMLLTFTCSCNMLSSLVIVCLLVSIEQGGLHSSCLTHLCPSLSILLYIIMVLGSLLAVLCPTQLTLLRGHLYVICHDILLVGLFCFGTLSMMLMRQRDRGILLCL